MARRRERARQRVERAARIVHLVERTGRGARARARARRGRARRAPADHLLDRAGAEHGVDARGISSAIVAPSRCAQQPATTGPRSVPVCLSRAMRAIVSPTLVDRAAEERAGVHDRDVGLLDGRRSVRKPSFAEQAEHGLGVDLVLGAAERDERERRAAAASGATSVRGLNGAPAPRGSDSSTSTSRAFDALNGPTTPIASS